MATTETRKHLIYFGDPMCSWCYGFEPVLKTIADHFGERLPIGMVLGGLRVGTQHAMTPKDKDEVRHHWEHVNEASGQPFDYSFFDRDRFVYDTEPACRAVALVRRTAPDSGFGYFADLQRAFYGEGRDITKADVLAGLTNGHGLSQEAFLASFDEPSAHKEVQNDFYLAQKAGVRGFPTLLAGTVSGGLQLVCQGYRPIDGLIEGLEAWLAGVSPDDDSATRH